MSREKTIEITKRGIDLAEEFCDKMLELETSCMDMLRDSGREDLVLAGKKAICDGMSVQKAVTLDHLLALCREADNE